MCIVNRFGSMCITLTDVYTYARVPYLYAPGDANQHCVLLLVFIYVRAADICPVAFNMPFTFCRKFSYTHKRHTKLYALLCGGGGGDRPIFCVVFSGCVHICKICWEIYTIFTSYLFRMSNLCKKYRAQCWYYCRICISLFSILAYFQHDWIQYRFWCKTLCLTLNSKQVILVLVRYYVPYGKMLCSISSYWKV